MPTLGQSYSQQQYDPYYVGPSTVSPQTAAIAGGVGVLGGVAAGISNLHTLNKLKKQNLVPEAVAQGAGQRFLQEKSAKAANYGAASDQITENANVASGNAMASATSPAEAIAAQARIQSGSNKAYRDLNAMGADQQRQARNSADQFRKIIGDYQNLATQQYGQEKSALRNAALKNFSGAANSAAQAVLLGGG